MIRKLLFGFILAWVATGSTAGIVSAEFKDVSCLNTGTGKDYQVGPGQSYLQLSDVPWSKLQAGDTVRVHWRQQPYMEKLIINGNGTEKKPIRICGVPNENGRLPWIQGKNARTPSGLKFGHYIPLQDLGVIIVYDLHYKKSPSYVTIENFLITGGHPDNGYFTGAGERRNYARSAACIWVQEGNHITIRNNTLSHCGNGLFVMSKPDNIHSLTQNILIEKNHLYANGVLNSDRQHNLYIQAIGATYQYNIFGRNIPGSLGGNLKDRSVGTVIRYNWFDGGARVIDLVEAQEHAPWVLPDAYKNKGDQTSVLQKEFVESHEPAYRKSYVYGNLIRNIGSTDGRLLIHYGYDTFKEFTRSGTLYFYNNTIVNLSDKDRHWKTRLFDISTRNETVKAFRNILYFSSENGGEESSDLYLTRDSGNLILINNLLPELVFNGKGNVKNIDNENYSIIPVDTKNLKLISERLPKLEFRQKLFEGEFPEVEYQFSYEDGILKREAPYIPGALDLSY